VVVDVRRHTHLYKGRVLRSISKSARILRHAALTVSAVGVLSLAVPAVANADQGPPWCQENGKICFFQYPNEGGGKDTSYPVPSGACKNLVAIDELTQSAYNNSSRPARFWYSDDCTGNPDRDSVVLYPGEGYHDFGVRASLGGL
jgi:hypothetical protein